MNRLRTWMNKTGSRLTLPVLLFFFFVITLPRFNSNTLLVSNIAYDAKYFVSYVQYFRNEAPSQPLRPASNWRFLVPLLASALPFEPATAINIVNMFCFTFALFILYKTNKALEVPEGINRCCVLLFIISFPTFFYTSITYVEPGALLFVMLAVYATVTRSLSLMLLAVIAGTAAKETLVMAFPFYLLYHIGDNKWRAIAITGILFLLYLTESSLIHTYAPLTHGESNNRFWAFGWINVERNLHRLNSWLAPLLSFGPVGALFVFVSWRARLARILNNRLLLAAWGGLGGVMLLFGISYISTVADGRMIWQGYCFMLPAIAAELGRQRPADFDEDKL